jgi:hypothetical protein
MRATIADIETPILEELYAEAERHALRSAGDGGGPADPARADRWMARAGTYRAELDRRTLHASDSTIRERIAGYLARIVTARALQGARALPPITEPALAALAERFGGRLPPSYRTLLALHDGVHGILKGVGGLLASTDRAEYDGVQREQLRRARRDHAQAWIFGAAEFDGLAQTRYHLLAFDRTKPDPFDELGVIEISVDNKVKRYGWLGEFLAAYADRCEAG